MVDECVRYRMSYLGRPEAASDWGDTNTAATAGLMPPKQRYVFLFSTKNLASSLGLGCTNQHKSISLAITMKEII